MIKGVLDSRAILGLATPQIAIELLTQLRECLPTTLSLPGTEM